MKFYKGVSKLESFFVAVVTVLLVLVGFIQGVNRTLIKATIAWPEEAARYLMVWQVFLASVIAFRQGANCCIDVLINRFHGKVRMAMTCFANAVCLGFALVVTVMALEVMHLIKLRQPCGSIWPLCMRLCRHGAFCLFWN